MIRAITLDAGNTLFRERRSRGEIYAEVAARHGIDTTPVFCAEAMRHAHAKLPMRIDGAFRYTDPWFEQFIRTAFQHLGVHQVPAPLIADLFRTWREPTTFEVFPEVPTALAMLQRRGLRLAVISNWTPHLETILVALGLRPMFAHVFTSAIQGVEKPTPEIFHLATTALSAKPHETLHIGDHWTNDIEGARAAGLRAAWLNRSGSTEETHEGVSLLSSLVDVGDLPELARG